MATGVDLELTSNWTACADAGDATFEPDGWEIRYTVSSTGTPDAGLRGLSVRPFEKESITLETGETLYMRTIGSEAVTVHLIATAPVLP